MNKILVVEDNKKIRKETRFYLELHGYRVIEAREGREGIKLALSEAPDLILTDMYMPHGMYGYDMALKLRANPKTAHIPIIGSGGFSEEDGKVLDYYLPKAHPENPEGILAKIKELLGEG